MAELLGSAEVEEEQDERSGQYLTFRLATENYGIDILRVMEIRSWDNVTRIPNQSNYMLGVLNIRGTVIPIVDLRKKFGMEKTEVTPLTVVIVLRVENENGDRVMGLLVDAVSDVLNVTTQSLRQAPDLGSSVDSRFLRALAIDEDRMITLLEVDALLNSGGLSCEVPEPASH